MFAACGSPEDSPAETGNAPLAGTTWLMVEMVDENGVVHTKDDISAISEIFYMFEEEGVVTINVRNRADGEIKSTTKGTYTESEDQVTIKIEAPVTATITDNRFTYEYNQGKVTYEKVANHTDDLSVPESVADEILKLKQLLDSGAITQEEFDSQKKRLLGE